MNHQKDHDKFPFQKKNSSNHHSFLKKNDLAKKHSFLGQSSQWNSSSQQSSNQQQDEKYVQVKITWSQQQNLQLASLFNQHGLDWIKISDEIKNQHQTTLKRSPMDLKWHFYQILRRIVEIINLQLKEKGRKQVSFKSIQIGIEGVFECGDDYNIIKGLIKGKLSQLIIDYLTKNGDFYENSLSKSIEAVHIILSNLKRYRKKKNTGDKTSYTSNSKLDLQYARIEKGYMSDQSSVFQQQKEEEINVDSTANIHNNYYADEQNYKQSKQCRKGVTVVQTQQKIKDLLREQGILQMIQYNSSSKDIGINYQQSVASSSENLNNQSYQHFCLDQEYRIQSNSGQGIMSRDFDSL